MHDVVTELRLRLASILNEAKYPASNQGAAVLIAMGVATLRELKVPESQIEGLLIVLAKTPEYLDPSHHTPPPESTK